MGDEEVSCQKHKIQWSDSSRLLASETKDDRKKVEDAETDKPAAGGVYFER